LNVCVDSSFLVSSYITDAHSLSVDRRLTSAPSIFLTPFNRAELANAIYQQVFLGRLPLAKAQLAWNDFERDRLQGLWVVVDFPPRAWETCTDLAHRYSPSLGVRTLDSLHVACALELKAQKFWTFDERQARLAEAVGLDINA
jgi:predicted nucleic acid-binding protein